MTQAGFDSNYKLCVLLLGQESATSLASVQEQLIPTPKYLF